MPKDGDRKDGDRKDGDRKVSELTLYNSICYSWGDKDTILSQIFLYAIAFFFAPLEPPNYGGKNDIEYFKESWFAK